MLGYAEYRRIFKSVRIVIAIQVVSAMSCGARFFLLHTPRTDLLDLCGKAFLGKTGKMEVLRERLVSSYMHSAASWDADGDPSAAPALPNSGVKNAKDAEGAMSSSEGAAPPGSSPTLGMPVSSHASSSSKTVPPKKSDSVLNQCQLVTQPVKDATGIFTDLEQGPAVIVNDGVNKTAEIVAGADVVIPVAAMVKILHGLDTDPTYVTLLIAGQERIGFQSPILMLLDFGAPRVFMGGQV